MERKRSQNVAAFTLLELAVVVVILTIVAVGWFLLRPIHTGKPYSRRISCVNNLKQIDIAYRVWANDNNDRFPALAPFVVATNNGGWKDILTNQNQGVWCWTNYFIMQNELGLSPKILHCPSDERVVATDFNNLHNTNISYFIGVGASDAFPQSILGGDRNLSQGTVPQNDYGLSPANGNGNDVIVQTNSAKYPFSWSLKMHSEGNPAGAGNIMMGDGSVQQGTSSRFRTDYQPFAADNGNWPSNHVPVEPSFRLIFP